MNVRALSYIVMLSFVLGSWGPAVAGGRGGLARVVDANRLPSAQRAYVLRKRVPLGLSRVLSRVPLLRRLVRVRTLHAVTNETLSAVTKASAKGYLEVVVPADRGHVFYRLGERVYDFYDKGFRAGPVREIKGDRYGFMVRLTPKQEARIGAYFERLESTQGKELGKYDFRGREGFHCVSFMLREQLGARAGEHLVKLLGGGKKDGRSMPNFARFMRDKAKQVERVMVYKKDAIGAADLASLELSLVSSEQLREARKEELRARGELSEE